MIILILNLAALVAVAQAEVDTPAPVEEFAGLSAREVMREGNRRLIDGKADGALGAYDQAAKLLPDAREIAFGRGLAHFDLKHFDDARTAFEQVAVEGTDSLATDAQYGIGASDHMEAIENTDNPELAISLLESAMRRYHRVLAEDPKHQGALDANYKAASVWRRIKQMQEQQEKQQSDEGEEGDEQEENKDKQKSDEKNDQDQQQKDSDDENSDQEKSDEQQQESDSSDKQDEKKAEQQSAQQKEQKVSQEQAQRQLREMMQALRERQKARQAQVIKMPVTPVDKDW